MATRAICFAADAVAVRTAARRRSRASLLYPAQSLKTKTCAVSAMLPRSSSPSRITPSALEAEAAEVGPQQRGGLQRAHLHPAGRREVPQDSARTAARTVWEGTTMLIGAAPRRAAATVRTRRPRTSRTGSRSRSDRCGRATAARGEAGRSRRCRGARAGRRSPAARSRPAATPSVSTSRRTTSLQNSCPGTGRASRAVGSGIGHPSSPQFGAAEVGHQRRLRVVDPDVVVAGRSAGAPCRGSAPPADRARAASGRRASGSRGRPGSGRARGPGTGTVLSGASQVRYRPRASRYRASVLSIRCEPRVARARPGDPPRQRRVVRVGRDHASQRADGGRVRQPVVAHQPVALDLRREMPPGTRHHIVETSLACDRREQVHEHRRQVRVQLLLRSFVPRAARERR